MSRPAPRPEAGVAGLTFADALDQRFRRRIGADAKLARQQLAKDSVLGERPRAVGAGCQNRDKEPVAALAKWINLQKPAADIHGFYCVTRADELFRQLL